MEGGRDCLANCCVSRVAAIRGRRLSTRVLTSRGRLFAGLEQRPWWLLTVRAGLNDQVDIRIDRIQSGDRTVASGYVDGRDVANPGTPAIMHTCTSSKLTTTIPEHANHQPQCTCLMNSNCFSVSLFFHFYSPANMSQPLAPAIARRIFQP
jgi:hypothetical protein